MFYLLAFLAVLAFVGFFLASLSRNGHRMVYSAALVLFWGALAAWTGGYIGG